MGDGTRTFFRRLWPYRKIHINELNVKKKKKLLKKTSWKRYKMFVLFVSLRNIFSLYIFYFYFTFTLKGKIKGRKKRIEHGTTTFNFVTAHISRNESLFYIRYYLLILYRPIQTWYTYYSIHYLLSSSIIWFLLLVILNISFELLVLINYSIGLPISHCYTKKEKNFNINTFLLDVKISWKNIKSFQIFTFIFSKNFSILKKIFLSSRFLDFKGIEQIIQFKINF